jgi:dTMP kinase
MDPKRGRFFVMEGIDGAGTTTQAHRLDKHLRDQGIPSFLTREPTDHPVGRLIREALSGQLVSPDSLRKIPLSEAALCLLFAADRIEHSVDIETIRNNGTHVICDRYLLSSIAYQSVDPHISPERVIEVNQGIAVPDVTFLLNVPVDQCLKRLEQRADSPTVYEKRKTLERISERYQSTRRVYENQFGPVLPIDGTKAPDSVHTEILGHLTSYISS